MQINPEMLSQLTRAGPLASTPLQTMAVSTAVMQSSGVSTRSMTSKIPEISQCKQLPVAMVHAVPIPCAIAQTSRIYPQSSVQTPMVCRQDTAQTSMICPSSTAQRSTICPPNTALMSTISQTSTICSPNTAQTSMIRPPNSSFASLSDPDTYHRASSAPVTISAAPCAPNEQHVNTSEPPTTCEISQQGNTDVQRQEETSSASSLLPLTPSADAEVAAVFAKELNPAPMPTCDTSHTPEETTQSPSVHALDSPISTSQGSDRSDGWEQKSDSTPMCEEGTAYTESGGESTEGKVPQDDKAEETVEQPASSASSSKEGPTPSSGGHLKRVSDPGPVQITYVTSADVCVVFKECHQAEGFLSSRPRPALARKLGSCGL